MKFYSTLSVSAVTLLYITGSLCQLDVCGRAPLNNKIVGGEDATAGSWPWQVSIFLSGSSHNCGGTLINKDWVLSAAHCFQDFVLSKVVIYFGRLSQSGSNPNETSRTAIQVINHPNYDSRSNDNDIALVQLSSSVNFSDYIKPVCLAAAGSVFGGGTESWVTGWGTLQAGGSVPDILQQVMIPVVNNSACAKAYEGMSTITGNMVCAGLLNQGGKDSCQGDSGGPMVSKKSSLWIQSGIVSFGEGCADPRYPGVYAEYLSIRTGSSLTRAATHLDLLHLFKHPTPTSEAFPASSYSPFLSQSPSFLSPFFSLLKDLLNSKPQVRLMKRTVLLYMLS